MKIAFLGTGQMGAPMAERLVDAGLEIAVYDRSPEAMAPLVDRGARGATSVADCLAGAEVAFACLPSPEVSRAVALDPGGAIDAGDLKVYVETSTIGAAAVEEIDRVLGGKGIAVLDAPVSGGPRGARAGRLTTMVAGRRDAFDSVRPLFDAMAGNVFYISETPGHGQVVKLANNMISAACMTATSEAAVMAVKAGVDARILIDVVNASTGRNGASVDKFPQSVLPRTFDYGGKLSTMYKDVTLCFAEAKRLDVPMWVGNTVVQLWFQAMCEGRGDDDYTTIVKTIEEFASGVIVGDPDPAAGS
ncbi:NAD(P)-dependent oxidoreductase [Microbaculum marinum]|uniref:NAD(P)-dependent oxidoreductase n=1 Tax=Microbaculum marinum TaxID=1764581 RepID=A0AAW9RVS5_9HYPH